jgi:hypothetical protein
MQHVDVSMASPALVASDGDGRTSRGPVEPGATLVQASSASDRWVLEVDGRRADRTDAYGWADAFTVPQDVGSGDAVLDYHTPPTHHALLALQGALWLLVLAVAVRMRFRSDAPSRSRPPRPDAAAAARGDGPADGEPAHDEPTRDDEPSREGEPVPAGAGAPT